MVKNVMIVGGGLVGSMLALALHRRHISVALVEQQAPATENSTALSARVSAINLASRSMLENLDILSACDASAISSLQGLTIWDEIGGGEITFDSAELGLTELGCIIENRALITATREKLAQTDVEIFYGDPPLHHQQTQDNVTLELSSGKQLTATLAIAADGAHSWLRKQTNIAIKQHDYQQQALIAVVETEKPHHQIARQVFLPSGPLALLPLANKHHCAIVWSNHQEAAEKLLQMNGVNVDCELNNAFGISLGNIACLTELSAFPLMMRHAQSYSDQRIVLIGDAAHTIHPLAGQGVNLGFLDAAALLDCLLEARRKKQDIGLPAPLRRYERWRKGHNAEMIIAMRAFHELFGSTHTLTVQARSQGMQVLNRLGSIKKHMMKVALGKHHDLPSLAKKRGIQRVCGK